MRPILAIAVLATLTAAASADGLTGRYIEARTCDVWTGPCFANAEMNLGGKNAVMGWLIEKGGVENVQLDGLGVVAVLAASDTLGLQQTGTAKAILIVDRRADSAQRDALVQLARRQGGALLRNVVDVQTAAIELDVCGCAEGGCGTLRAGNATIRTRCLEGHDKVCGNESAFYPPLARDVKVRPALAVEHAYSGKGVDAIWNDSGRRGAYLGSFEIR
jgi:hypothetical protein